jgi:hypothetical protein
MQVSGLTLADIIQMAYETRPDLIKQLTEFVDERKKKFNRQTIYKFYPIEFNQQNNAIQTNPSPVVEPVAPELSSRATSRPITQGLAEQIRDDWERLARDESARAIQTGDLDW